MPEHPRDRLPRPWWWDGSLAGGTLAVGVLTVFVFPVQLASDVPLAPVEVRLTLMVALVAVDLGRTRRPGVALVVAVPIAIADMVAGFSVVAVLVLFDLLYCAVLHGDPRTSRNARIAGMGLWVLGVGGLALLGVGSVGLVTSALGGAAFLLLPVWWAQEVRKPAQEVAAERSAAAQAARIAELDRRAAVAGERARIARELHDSVAGHLSAIALQSQAALRSDERAARERVLGSVRENSLRALEEMRALIGVLRTGPADGPEGEAGEPVSIAPRLVELPALVESARAGGLDVDTDLADMSGLPGPVDLTAYRIVQEALTNVTAHAPGARVGIALDRGRSGSLHLEVVNTIPRGVLPREVAHLGTGTGVEGMRVRAHAVGGRLEAGPHDDGWRVSADLPLATT